MLTANHRPCRVSTLNGRSVGMDEWLERDVNLTFGPGSGIDIETFLACGGAGGVGADDRVHRGSVGRL